MSYPQRLIQTLVGVVLIGGALASCQSQPRGFRQGPVRSDQPWPFLAQSRSDNPIPTPPPPLASPSPSPAPAELAQIAQPIPTPPPPLPSPSPVPKPPFPFPGRIQGPQLSSIARPRPHRIALSAFLNGLGRDGVLPIRQGVVVLDPQGQPLAIHQPSLTFPTQTLPQLATSLAALEIWGPDHRFETRFYTEGELRGQRLEGHLWVEGGFDPYFTSEDARAIARQLQNLGIRQVTGGLRVKGPFFMGGQGDPRISGQILLPHLDNTSLQPAPYTGIEIADSVQVVRAYPPSGQLLIRHASVPLQEILRIVNTYNSQVKAEILMAALGGTPQVESTAIRAAQLSPSQIQLGSGTADPSRISPLALAEMLGALRTQTGDLTTVLPELGVDGGPLNRRDLPLGTVAISEASDGVNIVAGQLPNGLIFALINQGEEQQVLEQHQARFLRDLMLVEERILDQ